MTTAMPEALDVLMDGEPDILADAPGVYSVARHRYPSGARYELTLTEHADPDDREACFSLLPGERTFVGSEDTNLHGTDYELTLCFWVAR